MSSDYKGTWREELYKKAIDKWGVDAQIMMVYEEKREFELAAMFHYRRGKASLEQVADEVADLEIMTEQARAIFSKENHHFDSMVATKKIYKLNRLEGRVNQ